MLSLPPLLLFFTIATIQAEYEEVRCLPGFIKSTNGRCYRLSNGVKKVKFKLKLSSELLVPNSKKISII